MKFISRTRGVVQCVCNVYIHRLHTEMDSKNVCNESDFGKY